MKPLLSVIIPIYNTEAYLRDTVNSIVKQSIGFTDNIELILVNDGSTDGSAEICKEYARKYPDNVQYVEQKNAGVSAARNNGLDRASAQFVHFMDADDILSKNFYKESIQFLRDHEGEIDLVASKLKLFDAQYSSHYLNGKFASSRVINVNEEPEQSIFHVSSVVIVREAVGDSRFDSRLVVTEDTTFLSQILRRKEKYGVLSSTVLYYRQRVDQASATDGKLKKASYFRDTPTLALEKILSAWTDDRGAPKKYAQYLVMNDIAWKLLNEKKQSVISEEDQQLYKNTIYGIVQRIDDEVIIRNRIIGIQHKVFLLKKKYANRYETMLSCDKGRYYFNQELIFRPYEQREDMSLTFDFIHDLGDGAYKIEGFAINPTISLRDERYIKTSIGTFPLVPTERAECHDMFLGDYFGESLSFKTTIKLEPTDRIEVIFKDITGHEVCLPIVTNQFTGLGTLPNTYCLRGETILRKGHEVIEVWPNTTHNHIKFETRFSLQILRNIQVRKALDWFKETVVNFDSLWLHASLKQLLWESIGPFALVARSFFVGILDVILRQLYFSGLFSATKPIWLVSDRGMAAGDNGEAFFRYVVANNPGDIEVHFVLSKKSSDFKRLREVGSVIDGDSLRYKMLFLRASKIISSAADYYVYNAFGYRWTHFNDLYKFDFIFLQHGITKDDMSAWLNRFEKNIKLFITAANSEYASLFRYNYYYDKDRVLLSGLPRFDLLESKPAGKLILAPTWRHDILPEERHDRSGIRAYSETFKQTKYFKFYNRFMNDTRILQALEAYGMKGELYLHPAFSRQSNDFVHNKRFTIKKMPYDYRTAFKEGNLLVTDYSSVAFDFAYLKKPVIYTQFDKDSLYENHIYDTGYFSYEDDGFGPVCEEYETAVLAVVAAIDNGSQMDAQYKRRVEKFFTYTDKNNSKRVYEAITKLHR